MYPRCSREQCQRTPAGALLLVRVSIQNTSAPASPPVTLRDYALRIVEATSLEEKLAPPSGTLDDSTPGEPLRIETPGRPKNLCIVPVGKAPVPQLEGFHDPPQRARIIHALANHELQAVELFAWAILAFSDASREFRSGLLRILREEIMHVRLYLRRLGDLGCTLGDFPVSGYFWGKVPLIETPAEFVCAMSLTFENANLDHSLAGASAAREAGDDDSARLLERIHTDERGHVRFGLEWLARWKRPDQTMVEAWLDNVRWPLRPALARGRVFDRQSREEVGLDPEFIRLLEEAAAQA